ncbi:MAG TPA: HD domain-containing phosphohydrolase [Gemmatimonadaceae bacterium]|nr:HD domain-containing phosphohydrolase [Gemmatimonadaceae bacterium]
MPTERAMPLAPHRFTAPAAFGPRRPVAFLSEAREHERAGRVPEAIRCYESAINGADPTVDGAALAEALRRLGVVRRRRHEYDQAIELCHRSYEVAIAHNDGVLAAEALNGIALVHIERGEWAQARQQLDRALDLGAASGELVGRIEQNLGIMANIHGDLAAAMAHYRRSLEAFRRSRDERGCAIAYHNLGMLSADQRLWDEAEAYYRASLEVAESTGDVHLRGHILLNRTEVHLARSRFEYARQDAEEALRIFDSLGMAGGKSSAYRFLGMVYRETGRPALAEARLRSAVRLSSDVGAALDEAEASRELALLYQGLGRSQEALRLLNASHRLFRRLDARVDLVDVKAKVGHLESVYLEIVREWGRSIESSDTYTHGHSERVATYAAALAAAMGLDETEMQTIRVGAYLHDLGKVRIPHEILNKPGRLTNDEFEEMKRHPEYGIELLASVEFPWEIRPIIRSHHEKLDGSGYPDRLRGDEIPLTAQLICIVDVYDALTTTRSYRGAMEHQAAVEEMIRSERWWRRDVMSGFKESVGR